ncbi:cytochrome P450 [Muricoccus radiodurans]|uniref:cytochrome P450 n=1 Tax=Muricoccus radiodurans TaxID=2231721 RepID=UPI003CF81D48
MNPAPDTAFPVDVVTPSGVGGFAAKFTAEQPLPALAARLGAWLAGLWGGPFRLGHTIILARHADVAEMLARDLDFRIAPVNGPRIDAVNGPFVLGLDRGATLIRERAALYRALSQVDLSAIRVSVAHQAAERIEAAGDDGIDVVGGYARPIAARTARALFGTGGPDERSFMDVARAIFAHVFLNLSGDKVVEARALRAAGPLRRWLADEIAARRAAGDLGTDMMGALLRDGLLDDDGVRRTLGGMLVGSIDTTATAVAKIIAVIGRDPALLARVAADAEDPECLAGWCREALRRWPHNPILMRRAAAPTRLGTVEIRAGDQVVAWTQAAMLDPDVFPDPQTMRPDRPAAAYLHFGGGVHPCAGRAINAFQIPLLVGALIRRGIAGIGPVEWAGPFPDRLTVRFGRDMA